MKPRSSYLKRRKPLPKSTSFAKRGGKPKATNPARKKREWARAYGSPERVAFVAVLPCIVCEWTPCENAHIEGGGVGRKADAATIVPLCRLHHSEQHQFGIATFGARHGLALAAIAAVVERAWLSSREGEAA